jgi:hypothetical protein
VVKFTVIEPATDECCTQLQRFRPHRYNVLSDFDYHSDKVEAVGNRSMQVHTSSLVH